ncbi:MULTISPECIES: YgfZ/GcvT domain-containing protein [Rugamonas]|uniref:CAF17-like 4Fe-4S cluster assembly/insertion protein YgfZ n=1 Tax=Rugamonas TaxID=212744 RepID=UPI000B8664E8|nr:MULTISPECIES: folate-binding protein YgfZ [Rugamonas]WGG53119.1 folate-binding protein YgfZ [Rugamonas sp. DEMB1]
MNTWNQLLDAQGARRAEQAPDQVLDFGRALGATELAAGFAAPVTDLGLIALNGEESASFLHGQLTNDVEHLNAEQVRLAGYCSPKGRLLASFLLWRDAETIYLQLPRAIQAPLQKRLQMFVLRAKTKLSDATAQPANEVVLGLGGALAEAVLRTWFDVLPAQAYSRIDHPLGTLLRLGDVFGAPRYQWLTSGATAATVWPLLAERLAVGGNDAWHLSEIHAGVPQIGAATQEQFVPQMVNYELLGGVNFKKGCYPGQEIVARSQYLGKLKRRTTLVSIADKAAIPGAEVFATADPEQPCGMVVNAAPNGAGGVDALVEMKLAAIDAGVAEGAVRLGSAAGTPLRFLAMPYVLDALDL